MLKNIALLAFCALAVEAEREWSSSRSKRSSGLIVDGQNAGKGKYPEFAMLFRNGTFQCGGTIIDKNSILTAAHCLVFSDNPDDYQVAVGKYRLSRDDGDEQYFDVKRISADNYTFPADDIAIMHLKGKMTYNKYVQPMALARSAKDENFTSCYVIGMGYISETIVDGEDIPVYELPRVLQEMETAFQSTKRCKRLHPSKLDLPRSTFTNKHLCTLDKDSGPCWGDSGSPVGCFNAEGTYVQMGILSYGSQLCLDGVNVYTRVSQYKQWIKDNR